MRIFSEILTSSEIETVLGLEATRTFSKGDPIFGRDKDGKKIKAGVRKNSAWILSSPSGGDSNLDDHLRKLLDVINPKADELKQLSTKCKVDIFCGFGAEGQGGFTLTAEIINRLAKLNLNLDLDLYPLSMDSGSEMSETF
ncbi:MAG TPA: DUF4279 domain-containing protein [Terriglobales bacterium]|nr:DUF4279 domain-containing protein [Terriglobales bacterium]